MTLTTILIITNVLTLLALIYLLVTNSQTNGNNIVIDPQTLGFTDTYTMSSATAFNLISNYTNHHLPVIQSSGPLAARRTQGIESDSRSIWFPANQMLRFLLDLKAQTSITCGGTVNAEQLGIRLYYAEYPEFTNEWRNTPASKSPIDGSSLKQYAGMHTIVMVPTYRDGNGKNVDFDPSNAGNSTSNGPKSMADVVTANSPAMMLNHGSMCPPPFPDNATITYYDKSGAFFLDPLTP